MWIPLFHIRRPISFARNGVDAHQIGHSIVVSHTTNMSVPYLHSVRGISSGDTRCGLRRSRSNANRRPGQVSSFSLRRRHLPIQAAVVTGCAWSASAVSHRASDGWRLVAASNCFLSEWFNLVVFIQGIDFEFARRIINAPKIDWDRVPTQQFTFCAERYADAVVVPWYQPMGKLLPYYVDAISGLMLFSPFPDEQYPDFHSYFHRKYDLTMSNSSQPLLKCSRELTGKNFLVPR